MKHGFFCEACGATVKSGADSCPSCGREFLAVRCPRCGHIGSSEEFSRGCPECSYLGDKAADAAQSSEGELHLFHRITNRNIQRKRNPLSDTFYWTLTALTLLALSIGLFFWIRSVA